MSIVISHSFVDTKHLANGQIYYGEEEMHLGCYWRIHVQCQKVSKKSRRLHFSLVCRSPNEWDSEKFITAKIRSLVTRDNGKAAIDTCTFRFAHNNMTATKDTEYGQCKELTVKYEIQVMDAPGIGMIRLRKADEAKVDPNDTVVLLVGKVKFVVPRTHLTSNFKNFDSNSDPKAMFLVDMSSKIFIHILAILDGKDAVDDTNVEDILRNAREYSIEKVTRVCEQFLIKTSEKSGETLKRLAKEHNLDFLKLSLESKKGLIPSDLLECPVCFDPFRTVPKVLPCGHSFCARCIRMVGVLCPTCRRSFNPAYVVSNYELKNVIDFIATGASGRPRDSLPHSTIQRAQTVKAPCRRCFLLESSYKNLKRVTYFFLGTLIMFFVAIVWKVCRKSESV